MMYLRISFVCTCTILFISCLAFARPTNQTHQQLEAEVELDVVGDVNGTNPAPRKALEDTIWIADWTFDTGAPCDETGWTHVDNWIRFSGNIFWHLEAGYSTSTGMNGNSYAVGNHNNACCQSTDGYDNDWYQGIRMTYVGSATISFDYILDSEPGFDFLQVESDSACSSYDRVDYDTNPGATALGFRDIEFEIDGLIPDSELVNLPLPNFGAGTHCVYIAFFSDPGYSPCDGLHPTSAGEGAVIDNISISDDDGTRTEDFEDGSLDIGTAMDMWEPKPFGTWARLFKHVTDNDICTENTTCSWLWSDDSTPTLFNDPSMAFGPGGYVIKNWLDEIVSSPWVSLASTPTANGTIIQMDRFGGNSFSRGRIVQNWSVRGRTIAQGSSCLTWWGHAFWWNSLSTFSWQFGLTGDMTSYFDPNVEEIQIRLRTSDWQWLAGASPPVTFAPGPGPYNDRIRIGRRVLSGPVMVAGDRRSQAQSCFPTEIDPNVTPAGGPKWRPSTDRFGTCAWSIGTDLGTNAGSPNLITGDSITIGVQAVRAGGDSITSVRWSGAIIAGPHAGKAPPPYTVGPNGFFTIEPDSVRFSNGTLLEDRYFVSLDDEYFRGGDRLVYFWFATDNGGGSTSFPAGLSAEPASIEEAQEATRGLLQVSYLPMINWDPAYLARIQADPHGKLEPTAQELANSAQQNCILLYHSAGAPFSGDVNRSSFMYALDRLGYRGHYDVYGRMGAGNTNNQLGGRATVEQAQGYSLIVMDAGRGFGLPDGSDLDNEKIDQAGWFRSWLAQAGLSEAQFATLWVIAENALEIKSGVPGSAGALLNTDMGVVIQATDQGLNVNPDVIGVGGFTFDKGLGSSMLDFAGDVFVLNGGCPTIRNYDGAAVSTATAVTTHRYRSPTTNQLGDAAIVMNRNDSEAYNTIMQTHPWFDIRDAAGTPGNPAPELTLLSKVLAGALPVNCLRSPQPTDAGEEVGLDAPLQTVLHQNTPNPFNPTTRIDFDLGRESHVVLRIYEVSGRLVRTLLNQPMEPKRHRILWDGMDDTGVPVPSGIYFYRFEADGVTDSRKMVVLR